MTSFPSASRRDEISRPKTKNPHPDRWLQAATVVSVLVFALGFWSPVLGAWTGAVISAWFVGTQKAFRGGLLLLVIAVIPSLFHFGVPLWRGGSGPVGWMFLAALLSVLPYSIHRLTLLRWPGFLSTFSLPLWGAFLQSVGQRWIPAPIFAHYDLAQFQRTNPAFTVASALLGTFSIAFLIYWSAAVIHWMWNQEFQGKKYRIACWIFGAAWFVLLSGSLLIQSNPSFRPMALISDSAFGWACLVGGLIIGAWVFVLPRKGEQRWAQRADIIARLRSPSSGEALRLVEDSRHEVLVSPSGERFPIKNGIPLFQNQEQLTGSNQKYHRLYEAIGGFYDDSQRFGCAGMGVHRDQIFLSYLRYLEIKSGDLILETSVGTGLNFKYLPRDTRLLGLDLSAEMLTACQANLNRWGIDATLLLGNAEELPFADNSLDVVYHVGGINFFNDRVKAIREMIRVAKPGGRILIADETEKYVSSAYERTPIARKFFKDRLQPVTPPIELVPPEMTETQLESLWEGRFYALTFRKPFPAVNPTKLADADISRAALE